MNLSALVSRFTPTHVGTMSRESSIFSMSIGSPPRTWGRSLWESALVPVERFTPTHVGTMRTGDQGDATGYDRFTPTHVGTIRSRSSTLRVVSVHPHARGDDWLW